MTLGLLALVGSQVDWSTAGDRLADGAWGWFALAVALLLAGHLVAALRWWLLLSGANLHVGEMQVVRAYMIGMFTNNFLPTSFGGDVTRAYVVAPAGPALVRALASVTVDRATALLCLVGLAWLALPLNPGAIPGALVVALLAVSLGGGLLGALMLRFALQGGQRLAKRVPARVVGWAREIRETLWLYMRQPRMLSSALLLGLAYQVLVVTALWMLAQAIGFDLPFSLAAIASALILVATLIPISIAGFGVREGAAVLVLGTADISVTDATLLSLVSVMALVLSSLPGAVGMLVSGPPPRPDRHGA